MIEKLPQDSNFKNYLAILNPSVNPEHCWVGQVEKEIVTVRKEVMKYGNL